MSAREQDIERLPFIGRRDLGEPGPPRHFWKVRSLGDGFADCALGGEYALAYLQFEAAQDGKLLLPWIVADMPRELTQLEIGFLSLVGEAAAAGLHRAEALEAHYRESRNGWRPGAPVVSGEQKPMIALARLWAAEALAARQRRLPATGRPAAGRRR
jgi:hypothetical protein